MYFQKYDIFALCTYLLAKCISLRALIAKQYLQIAIYDYQYLDDYIAQYSKVTASM